MAADGRRQMGVTSPPLRFSRLASRYRHAVRGGRVRKKQGTISVCERVTERCARKYHQPFTIVVHLVHSRH